MNVITLYNKTPIALRPWADAGYTCWAVDEQHEPGVTERDGIRYVGADLHDRYLPLRGDYAFAMAFVPCTHTAVSGARHFASKGPKKAAQAFDLLDAAREILDWCECPWFVENPVSTFSTYWRKPDHTFDPCDFGGYLTPPSDGYRKKTCLWTGGGFVMPERRPVPVDRPNYIHHMAKTPERADLRSATPAGFARAVFEANRPDRRPELFAAAAISAPAPEAA